MFLTNRDCAIPRGERWVLNQRYYRVAVNTGVTHNNQEQWQNDIEARQVWTDGEPSRSRRQDRSLYSSIANEAEWGVVEDGDDLQLWWYFMNEDDALLFKLRWC